MPILSNRDGRCTECREPTALGTSWLSYCERWGNYIHQNCERSHHSLPPFSVKESGPGWDRVGAVAPTRFGPKGEPK